MRHLFTFLITLAGLSFIVYVVCAINLWRISKGVLKKYGKHNDPEWVEKYHKKNPFTMTQFKKYRKKPVIVEAFQTNEEMKIQTLEGEMTAKPGDWIIRGVNGELYPCKQDVFEKTYEPVED